MVKKWILVVDSGLGGKYTLSKIKELLPNENYILFMDKTHAPYGNKTKKQLRRIVSYNFKKIFRVFNIKMVVLACNTLSSTCFEYLSKIYQSTPIIKIEPYFEPKLFNAKPTLILATKSTLKNNKRIKAYKKYKNIYCFGFKKIAKVIDELQGDCDSLQNYIYLKLKRFKGKNIKNIVLGCTHFNYIINQISNVFNDDLCFFENSGGVAKETYDVLKYSGRKSRSKKMGETLVLYKV